MPNLQRKARKKHQARLVFDPVEPGSLTMSPARIRYADPNVKNQKVYASTPTLDDGNASEGTSPDESAVQEKKKGEIGVKTLPSPQKSSQLFTKGLDSTDQLNPGSGDSDIEITSSRQAHGDLKVRTKKSTKMFTDGAMSDSSDSTQGSSDSSRGSEPEENEKEQRVRPKRNLQTQVVVDHDNTVYSDEEDSGRSSQENTGKAKRGKSQLTTPVKARGFLAGGNSYSAPIASSGRRLSSASKSGGTRPFETKHTTPPKSKAIESDDSTSDEDDLDIGMPTPKATQASSQRSKQPSSSAIGSRRGLQRNIINIESEDEESDSDEDLPSLSQVKKKTPEMNKLSLQVGEESEDDNDDDIVSSPMKRKRAVVEEDDDDDDIVSSPMKRKRVITGDSDDSNDLEVIPNPPSKKGKQRDFSQANNGSEDDATFLSPMKKEKTRGGMKITSAKSPGRLTRGRVHSKKPKRTAVQKQMELLRRKRRGEAIDELTDSDLEEGPALYDSGSELEVLSNFEDESEGEIVKVKKSPHKNKNKKDDDENDDFVVDDDEEEIGVPGYGLHDIPLEFTHASHKSKKEHFKDVIEWIVQKKINPAFKRDDPVYRTAFQKVDDVLRAQASSNFISSVWRPGFTRALNARPIFEEEYIGRDEEIDKCDACNRSNHPATYRIFFRGKPYHKDSLEDVDNDPDSDEEDDEHQVYNENGEVLPDEDTGYCVGRTCKSNAEMAHTLTHWKYALDQWIIADLKAAGHLNPDKLAAREEMSTKQRSKIAERIVDEWEVSKKIKELYSQLKSTLQTATHSTKNNRWGR